MNLLSSSVIRSSYISSFIIEMKYNNNTKIDKCKINIPPDYILKHELIPIITKVELSGIGMEMNNGYLEISTSFIEIPFDIVYICYYYHYFFSLSFFSLFFSLFLFLSSFSLFLSFFLLFSIIK